MQVCKVLADGTCKSAASVVTPSSDAYRYYLPGGTPCNAQRDPAGPEVAGICVTDEIEEAVSCQPVASCAIPSVAMGEAQSPFAGEIQLVSLADAYPFTPLTCDMAL